MGSCRVLLQSTLAFGVVFLLFWLLFSCSNRTHFLQEEWTKIGLPILFLLWKFSGAENGYPIYNVVPYLRIT
jgi:hypothetical protein